MSILGVIVRTRLEDVARTEQQLRQLPGVDIAQRPDRPDGRLVIVIEDNADRAAAAVMAEIAVWPQVLNTSLVYEYSGPDSPPPGDGVQAYTDWRASLSDEAGRKRQS
jgi:periplasmic nitrate reductase NapD